MSTSRRTFIRNMGLATAGLAIAPQFVYGQNSTGQKLKLGFIGTGLRGMNHVTNALYRKDIEITAICDIDANMIKHTLAIFDEHGAKHPKIYSAGE